MKWENNCKRRRAQVRTQIPAREISPGRQSVSRAAKALATPAVLSTALFAAWALPAAAALPPVTVADTELEVHVAADFTGDGLVDTVIVDRTSGAYRLGRQVVPGSFVWQEPEASGIAEVTAATGGIFLDLARYSLAVTAPDANRVNFVDPLHPAAGPVANDIAGALGPLSIASGQIAGTTSLEDLFLTSSLNSAPNPYRAGRYTNQPAGTLTLHGTAASTPRTLDDVSRVVLKTALDSTVAYMERSEASAILRVVSLNEPGSPVRLTVTDLPVDSRYLLVPFNGNTHGTLLAYLPGEDLMTRISITEDPANVYTPGAPESVSLPYPAASISAIDGGGEIHLAVMRDDYSEVSIFEYTGGNALGSLIQVIEAPSPALPLSGFVALGNAGGFVALYSDGAGRGTASARAHTWDPGTGQYTAEPLQYFGEIAPRAGSGNIVLLTAEPFVDPAARPVMLRNARDWTSGTAPVAPGSIDVVAESFLGEFDGLGDPVPANLGSFPAGASHSLLNQYHDGISVFTLARAGGRQTGQIAISPRPGVFSQAVQLSFSSMPAGLTIYFRDAGGTWQTYVDPGPEPAESDPGYAIWFDKFVRLVRFEETTIEYYGENGSGQRTPIRRAHYQFTAPPDTLSSLGDNVPDYVKLGLGLNPFHLPDGDASSGLSTALQHVLDGSGIDPRWLAGTAVDLYVRPLSHDGGANPATGSRLATNPAEVLPDGTEYTGNQVFVYSLDGSFIGQGADPIPATSSRNEGLGLHNPPFSEPSAFLPNIGGAGATVYLAATRPSFPLEGPLPPAIESSYRGRQLFGLLPMAAPAFPQYTRAYTGGTHGLEAGEWIAGAAAFYAGEPPPVAAETIDSVDVIAALVFERWLLLRFIERNLLPGSFTPPAADANNPPAPNPNFLSLSGFRSVETVSSMGEATEGALAPTKEALQALETWQPLHPSYRLTDAAAAIRDTVRTSADPDMEALRNLAVEIFRISAAHGNTFPGAFDPPIDVLRAFLATGEIPAPYRADFTDLAGAPFSALTPANYTSALNGLDAALGAPDPRPVQVLTLEFRPDSLAYPGCLVLNEVNFPAILYSLFNRDGQAFRLPGNFSILPGTQLQARVFTDAPFAACAGAAVEVINVGGRPDAEVVLLPSGTGEDTDGNLLGDEWEKAFFGDTGNNPWADINNDGYSNLQKYIAGKDPFLFPSYSTVPAAALTLPVLLIEPAGPDHTLISFEFPALYANYLEFELYENPGLSGDWTPAVQEITSPLPGMFEVLVPSEGFDRNFWRVGLRLK